LVTFSGEAEKVTARRAGALQREAAKLRPNYKLRNLRRRSTVTPKLKQNRAAKQTAGDRDGRPYGLRHKKCAKKSDGRQVAAPMPDKNPAATTTRGR
jgi:hypothetical protein